MQTIEVLERHGHRDAMVVKPCTLGVTRAVPGPNTTHWQHGVYDINRSVRYNTPQ